MKETLTEQLNIMVNEHLTASELFIIKIFLAAQEDNDMSYIAKYLEIPESDREDLRNILITLQNKAVILRECKIPKKGEQLNIFDIKFNKNFVKRIHKASFDLGKELYEAYPTFAFINGSYVQINTVSKKYDTIEDAFIAYGKAINNNPEEHSKIIELVNWAKENEILNCSLANFIVDRRWIALEQLKNGNCDANINFKAIQLI